MWRCRCGPHCRGGAVRDLRAARRGTRRGGQDTRLKGERAETAARLRVWGVRYSVLRKVKRAGKLIKPCVYAVKPYRGVFLALTACTLNQLRAGAHTSAPLLVRLQDNEA
eukprot:6339584-Prymnesium_polylepis.2